LHARLAVCRTLLGGEIPSWAVAGEFFCVVRTRDELSIVCAESLIPPNAEGLLIEGGWRALRLEGPFPFAMAGVLASFVQPLSDAQVPIFAISTFDTDYVLVKNHNLKDALTALGAAGHEEL